MTEEAVKTPSQALRIGFVFGVPVVQFLLFESFVKFPLPDVYPPVFLLSIAFLLVLDVLTGVALGNLPIGYFGISVLLAVSGAAMARVQELRGVPFQLSDLRSMRIAMAVSGGYDLLPSARILIVLAGFVVVLISCFLLRKLFPVPLVRNLKLRIVVVALCGAGLLGCWFYFVHDFSSRVSLSRSAGPVYGSVVMANRDDARNRVGTIEYLAGIADLNRMTKPDGYDSWTAPVDDWDPGSLTDKSFAGLPDIVVVMDEAFSDPDMYAMSVTDQDPMPFLRSFSGLPNARLGTMAVSIIGGNTANTELEFLAGTSMACFPPGSVPYIYAISRDIPSMARYLSDLGYETWALHPYYADGWNRKSVYSYMGFDNLMFYDLACGGYVFSDGDGVMTSDADILSDEVCYDTVLDILSAPSDRPRFIFLVTMYNHGGYDRDFSGLDRSVSVSDNVSGLISEQDVHTLETYLSLISKSDSELQDFCDALSRRAGETDLDTVMLFFGDHQPDATVRGIFDYVTELLGGDPGTYDRYVVPYGMWATYDLGFDNLSESACYAGIDVFEAIGAGLPEHYRFLKSMRDVVPVFTAVHDMSGAPAGADEYIQEFEYRTWQRLIDKR